MALILPSGFSLPTLPKKSLRGYRYGSSSGRPTVTKSNALGFVKAAHIRRQQRNEYMAALAYYWKNGSPLTLSTYTAFAAAYNPWLRWDRKPVTLTPYQAFLQMNEFSFDTFIQGIYNPRTDTPFSELFSTLNPPRVGFTPLGVQFFFDLPYFVLQHGGPFVFPEFFATIYALPPGQTTRAASGNTRAYMAAGGVTGQILSPGQSWFSLGACFTAYPWDRPTSTTTFFLRPNCGHAPVLLTPTLDALYRFEYP